jgi:hypothetical protein
MVIQHLLRFHLRAGGRVALRMSAPIPAALVAAAVLYGSPQTVLLAVAGIFSPSRPTVLSGVACMLLASTLAAWVAPRISLGVAGWLRHLPAAGVDQRRAACAAMVIAQSPILLVIAASCLLTGYDGAVTASRLAGLPVVAWGASLARLNRYRSWAGRLALCAALCAGTGWWWLLPVAAALLAGAESSAHAPEPIRVRRLRSGRFLMATSSPFWLSTTISLRAVGWRWLLLLLVPAATMLSGWFFLNNNQASDWQADCAARLLGGIGTVLLLSFLAEQLLTLRPPWPWVRSLPWTAMARIVADAALLGATAGLAIAAAASLRSAALLPLAAALPYLALRAATAIRTGATRAGGASGSLLAEGFIMTVLIALSPWSAVLPVVLIPLGIKLAAHAEQRQMVGHWQELVYLSAGDPLSRGDS